MRSIANGAQYRDFDTFVEWERELIRYQQEIEFDVGLPVVWPTVFHEKVENERTCNWKEESNVRRPYVKKNCGKNRSGMIDR